MAEYTTEGEMVGLLGADTVKDRINRAIATAARVIENVCGGPHGRRSFALDSGTSVRTYRVRDHVLTEPGGALLLIDDIGDLTGLVVEVGDGTTWEAVTDFRPEPIEALGRGEPVTELRRVDQTGTGCAFWWPSTLLAYDPLARITARWGWPVVPADIADANRILATRYYRRKDAPWGVAGFGETGLARLQKEDPDVALILESYTRGGL